MMLMIARSSKTKRIYELCVARQSYRMLAFAETQGCIYYSRGVIVETHSRASAESSLQPFPRVVHLFGTVRSPQCQQDQQATTDGCGCYVPISAVLIGWWRRLSNGAQAERKRQHQGGQDFGYCWIYIYVGFLFFRWFCSP